MICLKCNNENFEEKEVVDEQLFRGETFQITISAMVCTKCGFKQLTDKQADKLYKKTKKEYENRCKCD